MNKSKQIVKFIKSNKPTHKALTKFIVVNLNKLMTSKEFDELKSGSVKLSYYASNIAKWVRMGNVEVKNKRYRMTKYYNGHLYKATHKAEVEMLTKRSKHWKTLANNLHEDNLVLHNNNEVLKEKIKEIIEIIV